MIEEAINDFQIMSSTEIYEIINFHVSSVLSEWAYCISIPLCLLYSEPTLALKSPISNVSFVSADSNSEDLNVNCMKLQLNDCTPIGNPDCIPRPGDIRALQLTFFCGNHPHCRVVGNRWALQNAKANVDHYSVIGLKEDLPTTLKVLEHVLPDFFKNYQNVEFGSGKVKLNKRPKEFAPAISNTTIALLKSSLREDIEFYDFVRQRFYQQVKVIEQHKKSIRNVNLIE
ncbi:hypothetical protein SK128_003060 [Halocaridina rubra]|uniref:Uncharacterized protein n=1 Tax=Halocaridina rubra TaxID=373956 RepID=A0AAN8ZYS9_HALRR